MDRLPTYNDFAAQVRSAGLLPKECGEYHWQIQEGERLVNVWPSKKRGLLMGFDKGRAQTCSVATAIKAAGKPCPNGEDVTAVDSPTVTGDGYWDHRELLESLVRAVDALIDSGLSIPAKERRQLEAVAHLIGELELAREAVGLPF